MVQAFLGVTSLFLRETQRLVILILHMKYLRRLKKVLIFVNQGLSPELRWLTILEIFREYGVATSWFLWGKDWWHRWIWEVTHFTCVIINITIIQISNMLSYNISLKAMVYNIPAILIKFWMSASDTRYLMSDIWSALCSVASR